MRGFWPAAHFQLMFLFQILVFLPFGVQGMESLCSLTGEGIRSKANEFLQTARANKAPFPDSIVLGIGVDASFSKQAEYTSGFLEAFYRPAETKSFSLPQIPLISVDLERDKHLIYVCAEKAGQKLNMLVYFFGTRHLDSPSTAEAANLTTAQDSEFRLTPLTLSVLKIGGEEGGDHTRFNPFRIVLLPINLVGTLNEGFLRSLSKLSGIEVESIRMTEAEIEVSGGVDLSKPGHSRFKHIIRYDSPEAAILDQVEVTD